MSRCVNCGETVIDGSSLSTYHLTGHGADWATANRIMCDFIHRGIVAPGDLTGPRFPLHVMPEEIGAPAVA